MLDFDLPELYGVETKVLNQAVKRNRERFPDDLMLPFLFYVKRKGNPKEKPAPLPPPVARSLHFRHLHVAVDTSSLVCFTPVSPEFCY